MVLRGVSGQDAEFLGCHLAAALVAMSRSMPPAVLRGELLLQSSRNVGEAVSERSTWPPTLSATERGTS
jgi:hypothetical protein